MANIQAVIFDLDGTLADTIPLIVSSWNAACTGPMGRVYSTDEVVAHFGVPDVEMLRGELPEAYWQEAEQRYFDHYESEHGSVKAFDGINELLRQLAGQGLPLAVFTGKGRRTADISIAALGWSGVFGSVITGNDVEHQKPHPEGVLLAARELNVSPPECIYVGDSQADIKAGRAAGALTVAAGWHLTFAERLRGAGPDIWADHPSEVAALVIPEKYDQLLGIWKGRGTTHDLMRLTRGEE